MNRSERERALQMLIELFRLAFGIQTAAIESPNLDERCRIALHHLVANYLKLSSQLLANPSMCLHVQQVGQSEGRRGIKCNERQFYIEGGNV